MKKKKKNRTFLSYVTIFFCKIHRRVVYHIQTDNVLPFTTTNFINPDNKRYV